jgi:hypothetical protein
MPWGGGPWGGGLNPPIELAAAQAIRENVIRLAFSAEAYYSTILDLEDASIPTKYTISVVANTVGLNGEAARPVSVVRIDRPTAVLDGIDPLAEGRLLDVILDRPMTPWAAEYAIAVTGIYTVDKVDVIPNASFTFYGLYRHVQMAEIDTAVPLRDFANPQSGLIGDQSVGGTVQPDLGVFGFSSGDYSVDQGLVGLKKRIVRRLSTAPGGFAHLPNYGTGIVLQGKKLGRASTLAAMAADAETQLLREPDVAKARVTATVDQTNPELVRFRVVVQMRAGKAQAFDVPFLIR